MKKIFKKVVAVVAATAMAVTAFVAMPSVAKAESTKDLYLKVEADATYSLGFWSPTGATINADAAADGWTYVFTKVEDGLYKLNVTFADDYTATGLSISVDGTETYKADPQWSGEAGAAAWEALSAAIAGADSAIYFSFDADNSTIKMEAAPAGDDTTTDDTTGDDTTSDDTTSDDTTADDTTSKDEPSKDDTTTPGKTADVAPVAAMLAVAVLAAVVVLKKRTVTE